MNNSISFFIKLKALCKEYNATITGSYGDDALVEVDQIQWDVHISPISYSVKEVK